MIEIYQEMFNIGELEIQIKRIPGKEPDQLVFGLEFLEKHKPWKRLEKRMKFMAEEIMWRIE